MRHLYKWSSVSWSAPQELCATTRSRFRAFVHLFFKCFMCGMKDSLRSKTTPRNLVSSTTGTGVPFSSRMGSGWGLRNLQKCMHTVKTFQPGDVVRVYYPRRYVGRSPKWQSYYSTVGQVVERLNDVTYLVASKQWKKNKVIHVDKIKNVIFFHPC